MQLELKPANKPRTKTLVRGELTYKLRLTLPNEIGDQSLTDAFS